MTHTIEIKDFGRWLCKLLSLDGIKSADRLESVLEVVESSSLNIEELKKAFTMYVNGGFPIEPRDNYLTVIQFNKVVNCYIQEENKKNTKTEIKKEPMKPREIIYYNKLAVQTSFNYFLEHREVDKKRIYVYDILDALGKLPKDKETKKQVFKDAQAICEREQTELKPTSLGEKAEFKTTLAEIQQGTSVKIIIKCKELVLAKFYRDLKDEKLTEFKKDFDI